MAVTAEDASEGASERISINDVNGNDRASSEEFDWLNEQK